MRHLGRVHLPQLDLFRPASPNPEWRQLRERRKGRVDAALAGGRNDE